jgi:hypothetical protein
MQGNAKYLSFGIPMIVYLNGKLKLNFKFIQKLVVWLSVATKQYQQLKNSDIKRF